MTRCERCRGAIVRSHDEAACVNCGHQVITPRRANDTGGDVVPADWEQVPYLSAEREGQRSPVRLRQSAPKGTRNNNIKIAPGVWSSDGCAAHPHCLTCPLSVCRYDRPDYGQGKTPSQATRHREIYELAMAGIPKQEIATRYRISTYMVEVICVDEKDEQLSATRRLAIRDQEICRLAAQGKFHRTIAAMLGISQPTVTRVVNANRAKKAAAS